MVQNPPCWRASSLLLQHWDIKTKASQASLVQVSVLMSQRGNNNELALQHGGFCTMWSLVAKGLLKSNKFWFWFWYDVCKFTSKVHSICSSILKIISTSNAESVILFLLNYFPNILSLREVWGKVILILLIYLFSLLKHCWLPLDKIPK